jgi:hypothetical protein
MCNVIVGVWKQYQDRIFSHRRVVVQKAIERHSTELHRNCSETSHQHHAPSKATAIGKQLQICIVTCDTDARLFQSRRDGSVSCKDNVEAKSPDVPPTQSFSSRAVTTPDTSRNQYNRKVLVKQLLPNNMASMLESTVSIDS